MKWVSGLDLGQSRDFTALACLEIKDGVYLVRHAERFELGVDYTQMMELVASRFENEPLKLTDLCVDYTGVGRPVTDIMRRQRLPARITPITITAGHKVTYDEEQRAWHVPKKELVSTLQLVMQKERLKIAAGMKYTQHLKNELASFKVKVSKAGNEKFGEIRDGYHDDLVMAVMLAAWLAEYASMGDVKKVRISPVERSVAANTPRGMFDDMAGDW